MLQCSGARPAEMRPCSKHLVFGRSRERELMLLCSMFNRSGNVAVTAMSRNFHAAETSLRVRHAACNSVERGAIAANMTARLRRRRNVRSDVPMFTSSSSSPRRMAEDSSGGAPAGFRRG